MDDVKPKPPVTYRLLTSCDHQELLKLYQDEAFTRYYGPVEEANMDLLNDDQNVYVSIFSGDEWIGFMSLTDFNEESQDAWVSIGLKPTWWGRGVGTAVLGPFIEEYRLKRNLQAVRLSVFSTNSRALHLYEHIGFEIEEVFWLTHQTAIYQLCLKGDEASA